MRNDLTVTALHRLANGPAHYIVQLTDAHLGKLPGTALLGVDTDASLAYVVSAIQAGPSPELLLCTGDLSNDGSRESYQRFQQHLASLPCPQVWLPGNHDEQQGMSTVLAVDCPQLRRRVDLGNWTVIMLDSSIDGKVEGALSAEELEFLDGSLQACRGRHVLICVHHHALPVGCHWLDQQRLANANPLLMLLEHYDCVRALVSGHVHQEFQATYAQFEVITSPSTCIQFARHSDQFKVDGSMGPGYRWFNLFPDGHFETGIERVSPLNFKVDLAASGY